VYTEALEIEATQQAGKKPVDIAALMLGSDPNLEENPSKLAAEGLAQKCKKCE
jgi:hypothetical protein